MASGIGVYDESYTAENDLSSTGQFLCVELSAANQVDVCDAATDIAIGILQNKPAAGQAATVRLLGRSKAVLGGTVTAGAAVGTANDGELVAKTTNNDWAIGFAEEAGDAGEIVSVRLTGGFYVGA